MFTSVAQANAAVIEQIRRARPHWLDVQPASSLISELNEGKTLLHAGPPMCWQEMTGPMKGACVGACLFEGWAKDEAQALAMLDQGEVNFIPCHHVNAVGPMGGITSASMPMLVVENVTDGNRAYCNLNEGIGKVMRFGAYGEDVLTRHRWMRDVLMPVLSAALGRMERVCGAAAGAAAVGAARRRAPHRAAAARLPRLARRAAARQLRGRRRATDAARQVAVAVAVAVA